MAIGTMEVLLVTAKGLGDTDFFGTIYLYIYIHTYVKVSLFLCPLFFLFQFLLHIYGVPSLIYSLHEIDLFIFFHTWFFSFCVCVCVHFLSLFLLLVAVFYIKNVLDFLKPRWFYFIIWSVLVGCRTIIKSLFDLFHSISIIIMNICKFRRIVIASHCFS